MGKRPPPGTAVFRVGLAASVDNDVANGWLFFDRVSLTALSQPIPIVPGQSLDIAANVRGVLDGPAGETSGQLAAPQTHSGTAVHATATQMRVGLTAVLVCAGQQMVGSE